MAAAPCVRTSRVHTVLDICARDMEAGQVSVRLHHGGPQGAKPKAEVIAEILASIMDADSPASLFFRRGRGLGDS